MSLVLASVIVSTVDRERLARFWADALGWQVLPAAGGHVTVTNSPDGPVWGEGGTPRLEFVEAGEPPGGRNRIHLDIASSSHGEQQDTVDRLLTLGATRVDIGQRGVPWEVLGDPDGNELCVLEPREAYAGRQGIAAVVIRCRHPRNLETFWSAVTGWRPHHVAEGFVGFSHGAAADLELLAAPGDLGGQRLALGATLPDVGKSSVEVARLERAGGRRVGPLAGDGAGRGSPTTAVVADEEGTRLVVS